MPPPLEQTLMRHYKIRYGDAKEVVERALETLGLPLSARRRGAPELEEECHKLLCATTAAAATTTTTTRSQSNGPSPKMVQQEEGTIKTATTTPKTTSSRSSKKKAVTNNSSSKNSVSGSVSTCSITSHTTSNSVQSNNGGGIHTKNSGGSVNSIRIQTAHAFDEEDDEHEDPGVPVLVPAKVKEQKCSTSKSSKRETKTKECKDAVLSSPSSQSKPNRLSKTLVKNFETNKNNNTESATPALEAETDQSLRIRKPPKTSERERSDDTDITPEENIRVNRIANQDGSFCYVMEDDEKNITPSSPPPPPPPPFTPETGESRTRTRPKRLSLDLLKTFQSPSSSSSKHKSRSLHQRTLEPHSLRATSPRGRAEEEGIVVSTPYRSRALTPSKTRPFHHPFTPAVAATTTSQLVSAKTSPSPFRRPAPVMVSPSPPKQSSNPVKSRGVDAAEDDPSLASPSKPEPKPAITTLKTTTKGSAKNSKLEDSKNKEDTTKKTSSHRKENDQSSKTKNHKKSHKKERLHESKNKGEAVCTKSCHSSDDENMVPLPSIYRRPSIVPDHCRDNSSSHSRTSVASGSQHTRGSRSSWSSKVSSSSKNGKDKKINSSSNKDKSSKNLVKKLSQRDVVAEDSPSVSSSSGALNHKKLPSHIVISPDHDEDDRGRTKIQIKKKKKSSDRSRTPTERRERSKTPTSSRRERSKTPTSSRRERSKTPTCRSKTADDKFKVTEGNPRDKSPFQPRRSRSPPLTRGPKSSTTHNNDAEGLPSSSYSSPVTTSKPKVRTNNDSSPTATSPKPKASKASSPTASKPKMNNSNKVTPPSTPTTASKPSYSSKTSNSGIPPPSPASKASTRSSEPKALSRHAYDQFQFSQQPPSPTPSTSSHKSLTSSAHQRIMQQHENKPLPRPVNQPNLQACKPIDEEKSSKFVDSLSSIQSGSSDSDYWEEEIIEEMPSPEPQQASEAKKTKTVKTENDTKQMSTKKSLSESYKLDTNDDESDNDMASVPSLYRHSMAGGSSHLKREDDPLFPGSCHQMSPLSMRRMIMVVGKDGYAYQRQVINRHSAASTGRYAQYSYEDPYNHNNKNVPDWTETESITSCGSSVEFAT